MPRHYKLSSGSASSSGDIRGRSSICERYNKDWASVGKCNAAVDAEAQTIDTFDTSPMLTTAGSTGGTAEPSLIEDRVSTPGRQCEEREEPTRPPTPISPTTLIKRLPPRLREWTSEDVSAWSASLRMPLEVVTALRENAINGNVLETLSEGDLVTMGMIKLGWRRQLICHRNELISQLCPPNELHNTPTTRPTSTADGSSRETRPYAAIEASSAREVSPTPLRAGGTLQRTPSSLRASAGVLPSARVRSPSGISEVPTPGRAGAGPGAATARGVTMKMLPAMSLQSCGSPSKSFAPMPKSTQNSGFSTPSCAMPPPRATSAIRLRTEESPVTMGMTPRSVSCIRTRVPSTTSLWQPCVPSSLAIVSAVPIVAAAPVGAIMAQPPVHPLKITVQPLSPSSGRIRQAPCRRVRSTDRLDLVAGARPLTPSSGRVRQAPARRMTSDGRDTQETEARSLSRAHEEVEIATVETVFGAAAESWERINREVLLKIDEDFKELQRQFSQRLEQKATINQVKRFDTF